MSMSKMQWTIFCSTVENGFLIWSEHLGYERLHSISRQKHAITYAHASTHTIRLMPVKNSMHHFCLEHYCLGHCNEENERKIKNIKFNS